MCLMGVLLFAVSASAVPYDTLATDVNLSDAYTNPSAKVEGSSNEAAEAAWAEKILGLAAGALLDWYKVDGGYTIVDKNGISSYDPGFAWTYAVVKYGDYWALYVDEGDNLLNTAALSILDKDKYKYLGVSHVTFFKEDYGTSVPEPAALFLLGLGMLGIAGIRRSIKK